MSKNEVEIIDADIRDVATQQQTGGLLDASTDNILYMAQKAEQYIDAMNRIMDAALRITNEYDWVLIGGKPYLQESGTTKVARLFGISYTILDQSVTMDNEGYKTFTYKARFMLKDQFIECEGSRSMRDDFFAKSGKDNPLKKPDEIDERDVKMAAYTNCVNNGIKRIIPNLRNIDVAALERAGLDVNKIAGYTFKSGGKKAEESGLKCEQCGKAITQTVASFSQGKFGKMLCMECQKAVNAG